MALIAESVRALSIAIFLLTLASALQAQVGQPEINRPNRDDKSAFGSIRGRITLPDGNYVNGSVKVTLQTLRGTVNTIFSDNQGQFEFPDLIPGNYQIEADPTDWNSFDVTIESIQVFKGAPSIVNITLKTHAHKNTDKAGTVSIAELGQRVPGSARKEFEKASKATQDGLADEAIAHLRKAIEIYPDFVMAYNDLGVQLLSQGKLGEAAEALEHAVSLDRKAFNPALNLGIALVHLHRFPEANEMIGRALAIQPGSAAARLYSGLAFKGLGDLDNAEKNLKSAYETGGPHYAQALFYLGQIYLTQGNRNLSLEFLERYLAEVPNAANADQVRKMIASLR
jgi:tetratricopeptide (TPR) repeat protein